MKFISVLCLSLTLIAVLLPATLLEAADEPVSSEADLQMANRYFTRAENYLREASANSKYGLAIDAYRKAAELGNQNAEKRLAWLKGYLPTEPTLKARYRRELSNAKDGDVNAQFLVGEMCEYGIGVTADFERALFWYQKAAKYDSGEAQNRLGELYAKGKIGEQDSVSQNQANQWIIAAANNEFAEAQFKLAMKYLEGEQPGFEKDIAKAFHWFERSASNGYVEAQMRSGFMLREGDGVKQDYEKSLFWFQKALENGHPAAQKQVDEVNYILDEIFLKTFK